MIVSLEETFGNYHQAKINVNLYIFLDILQGYCKLVVSGTLGMPGYAHPNWYYQLVETFCVYLQAENQFHTPCFSGDTAKICKLILGSLGVPDSINLQKSMFIYMPKIKRIIHFFLEILHFQEPCNFIDWQYLGP